MKLRLAASMALMSSLLSSTFKASSAFCPTILRHGAPSLISRVSGHGGKFNLIRSHLSSTTESADETTTTTSDDPSTSIYDLQAEALSKVESPFLRTMRDRGFLHQCTNLEDLDRSMMEASKEEGGALAAYLGFDATADSLHVGSLLQIMILRHLQQGGHKPIVLIGGGTSKVGDPTGKDASRQMLDDAAIQKNMDGISSVFQKFLTFQDESPPSSPTDAIMVNNNDWLSTIKYLDFLRDYGSQFTVNRMLSFESVKQRLARESPFSFLEFNYMILQAYDFLELSRRHGARLQLGGSDQWGNIVAGTELGRRCDKVQLFGLTAPLIATSDGKKMGKTANGAVWLNKEKCSEYDYWQFWRNTSDADVVRFMKLFTELPLEKVEEMGRLEGSEINTAKIVLADEATAMLHGRDCLEDIHNTVESMFKKKNSGGGGTESLPRIFVSSGDFDDSGIKFADLFLDLKLASSKKEARRLIKGGGAKIGDVKITDEQASLTLGDFGDATEVTLRAGKKRAGVIELK